METNKHYHRLRYEEMMDLSEKFHVNTLTCGFMREPYYNEKNNHVVGFCYFREQLGLGNCKKTLPFKLDDCEVFKKCRR